MEFCFLDQLSDPGFIASFASVFVKVAKKSSALGSVVIPSTLLGLTVSTESLIKPRTSERIETADPCAIPTSLAISSMVIRPTCSTRWITLLVGRHQVPLFPSSKRFIQSQMIARHGTASP
nr:hypothetical protein HmN_000132100 [Hymenolepis microstoma]